MFPTPENRTKEPIHLLLLRTIVFSAALATGLWSVASLPVLVAVLAAGLVGVIAGRELAVTRVRTGAILAGCASLVGCGWVAAAVLGSASAFAHAVGVAGAWRRREGFSLLWAL